MNKDYSQRIKNMALKAGRIALDLYPKSQPALKQDCSVITKADLAISRLVHEELSDLLKTSEHILIEEEDKDRALYFDQTLLQKTPFIWSIDPIDGTRLYANHVPFFGISIGLSKNLRPWMGAVYFPLLEELFFCDGSKAFFIQNAFSRKENRKLIKPIDQTITHHSLLMCDDSIFKNFEWDYKDCQLIISSCATVDLCWPSMGRACGALFRSCLWDFAGSWPIFQAAGLDLRSFNSGAVLERLDADKFNFPKKPWELKDYYILSSRRNYDVIKQKLKPLYR